MVYRIFLLLLLLGPAAPAAASPVPAGGEIRFEVLRGGDPFGMHHLHFSQGKDGTITVDIGIEMDYTLGFVTLFHYRHRNQEIWAGDRLLSVISETDDDGELYQVSETNIPPGLFSTSYWNPAALEPGKILNTQKGLMENIAVMPRGREEFCIPAECMMADRYEIRTESSAGPITIWYDTGTRQWVGLKFTARGADIEYRRLTPIRQKTGSDG